MCSTCHEPHLASGAAEAKEKEKEGPRRRSLLRSEKKGALLCEECHAGLSKGDSRSWHILVAESAHGNEPEDETAPRGQLDALSKRCLSCHDGTSGRDVGFRIGRPRLDVGSGASHPVGVRYPMGIAAGGGGKRRGRARKSRYVARPDERIRLFDGKVGCGSCHNPYSQNAKFLVIDPRGGRLCLSCHNM